MNTTKTILLSSFNMLNIGGVITTFFLNFLSNTSYFLDLISPVLNAAVVITVITYNVMNISRLKRGNKKENDAQKPL